MPKSATFDNGLLQLIFNGTAITSLAINATASPFTSLYVSLHTADPTITAGTGTLGTQNASEMTTAAYAGYARVGLLRVTGATGWTVTGSSVSPGAAITFPAGTGGTGATATFWSVGVVATAGTTGLMLYSGAISPTIVCGNGVTPILTTASTITES